jgi:hypothetical protein
MFGSLCQLFGRADEDGTVVWLVVAEAPLVVVLGPGAAVVLEAGVPVDRPDVVGERADVVEGTRDVAGGKVEVVGAPFVVRRVVVERPVAADFWALPPPPPHPARTRASAAGTVSAARARLAPGLRGLSERWSVGTAREL